MPTVPTPDHGDTGVKRLCQIVYGERYRDLEQGGRVVVALAEGGNGVWCRFEDTGDSFHCNVYDFCLWGRFDPLNPALVLAEVA